MVNKSVGIVRDKFVKLVDLKLVKVSGVLNFYVVYEDIPRYGGGVFTFKVRDSVIDRSLITLMFSDYVNEYGVLKDYVIDESEAREVVLRKAKEIILSTGIKDKFSWINHHILAASLSGFRVDCSLPYPVPITYIRDVISKYDVIGRYKGMKPQALLKHIVTLNNLRAVFKGDLELSQKLKEGRGREPKVAVLITPIGLLLLIKQVEQSVKYLSEIVPWAQGIIQQFEKQINALKTCIKETYGIDYQLL